MKQSERLEAARIIGRYKRMVLLGRARLPIDAARRLVGPDCAYHLYFYFRSAPSERPPARRVRSRSRPRRRTPRR